MWMRNALAQANSEHNDGLPRIVLKMATGAGKTVVMPMLIAWLGELLPAAGPGTRRSARRAGPGADRHHQIPRFLVRENGPTRGAGGRGEQLDYPGERLRPAGRRVELVDSTTTTRACQPRGKVAVVTMPLT